MIDDIRHCAHDERVTRDFDEMPEDEWEEFRDHFERPIKNIQAVEEPNFLLYFKGMVSEHLSNGRLVHLAAITTAVCDPSGNLLLKIQKPVSIDDVGTYRKVVETATLIKGLNFSIYSKDIETSLGYDQSTLNTISFFKDLGANVALASSTSALITCVKNFPTNRGIVIGLLKGFVGLSDLHLTGHLGDLHLADATLVNSWGTITGFSLKVGLSGALETLCSQAYGTMLYKMLGIYLQSSIIISIFFSILVSVSWYFSEPIHIWLHQEPQVANMATLYLQCLIPGLYAYALSQCMLRFLHTQTVVIPLVVCSVVPLLINVGLAYVTVHVLELGFKGVALSASVSIWISFVMLAIYVKYSNKFRYTWKGFTAEALHHSRVSFRFSLMTTKIVIQEIQRLILIIDDLSCLDCELAYDNYQSIIKKQMSFLSLSL
ncbi:hypothetical protein ZIOFF_020833 [Zingiber officinale]|uniref:Nodulin-like domain-containing protein n=1 Tax=Zingiber officinale TaxID=94328 RepID=A0A8J5L835_ZINOF|nr:hypothetical protein ZIOFF_020833 [Zingiber officinale]